MANNIHKGSEFNNISETWDQNEKKSSEANVPERQHTTGGEATQGSDLEQIIKQEAAEYDNEPKENQLLSGERATVNDDVDADDSGE